MAAVKLFVEMTEKLIASTASSPFNTIRAHILRDVFILGVK